MRKYITIKRKKRKKKHKSLSNRRTSLSLAIWIIFNIVPLEKKLPGGEQEENQITETYVLYVQLKIAKIHQSG